ncbi:hypothetical protein HBI88_210830 [Parastagonospora nodorum]|nr:hypothetical protein HBI97_217700 [Parastagonospora nodorum]KAH5804108.1 hypothetical protein HBI94_191680 [Parastagonospora nodorum]KAH5804699.1 hypothetical protein HBI96_123910 [Parastagonospora nodorum]KAH5830909.1 hypothetical protein HBI93_126400 [Parastagonospora nodorum]KAH5851938.1 hypothetical protein HBI90_206900 [Parastagonospora nodorum]
MHCAVFLLAALASHAAAVEVTSTTSSVPGSSSTALLVVSSSTDLSISLTLTASRRTVIAGGQPVSSQTNATSSRGAAATMNTGQAGGVAAVAIGVVAWLV